MRRSPRLWAVAAVTLMLGCLPTGCGSTGRSLTEFDSYTHVNQPPCGTTARRLDPTLVAWVRGARTDATAAFVAAHTEPPWSHRVAVGDQWFQVEGGCSASVAALGSAPTDFAPDRFHIRFSKDIQTAGRWGRSLLSTPHWDAHCFENGGHHHYVPADIEGQTGFDYARDRLVEQMAAAGLRVWATETWGNTAVMGMRCGRPPTGSADGRVILLQGPP